MTAIENSFPRLPDAAAREAILRDTGRNFVVEAAAGTGKTTCLVGRLMTLFKQGALSGESRLAAVTFTHKAAAELRERLALALDAALADAGALADGEEAHLRAAKAALPECHIGTIHSFCSRLLRERPVEAGISPDFQEVDETVDSVLREQAWTVFADQLARGQHGDVHETLAMFGLDPSRLRDGFLTFSEYPDVDNWLGGAQSMETIDVAGFVRGVEQYCDRVARFGDALASAVPGTDELIPILQVLVRRLPRLSKPIGLDEAFRLSGLFKAKPRLIKGNWEQLGLDKDGADEELAGYLAFHRKTVEPFRGACLDAVYGAALAAFHRARVFYDRLRREKGWLNFQDLLLVTAGMLRDFPEVRADLARRYARLLVDEVQDTDPIQAEILFFLTGTDMAEKDWRQCRPRPGSLFMVGDPKQSIYRFRRADIAVYQEVKRLIIQAGGGELGLSSNFRSQPDILDWVNRVFCPEEADPEGDSATALTAGHFSRCESVHSPAYIPLEPGLPPTPGGLFAGVFALEMANVDKKGGMSERRAMADEAERIASFIKWAVDTKLPLPGRDGSKPASPGDFLIITPNTKRNASYAAALRRLGLVCQVSGGATLQGSPALELLLSYLAALNEPDDPVLTTAVLRGGLFGVSDAELYRWKTMGGTFLLAGKQPVGGDSPVRAALDMMARHHRLFLRQEPVSAFEYIVDDLGMWPFSCLGEDPANSAAVLAAAVELVKAERIDLPTLGKLRERLEAIVLHHRDDPPPVVARDGDVVRVMNLHQTKGLEAPVVFLTNTRRVLKYPPVFAVRRNPEGVSCAMAITSGDFNNVIQACPRKWDELSEEESRFLEAEKIRLNYVAATRAGAALIVTVHKASGTWQSAFLPGGKRGKFLAETLTEPPPAVPSSEGMLRTIDACLLDRAAAERAERRAAMLEPSYRVARAKPDGDWRFGLMDADPEDDATSMESALSLGEVLHKLLERGEADDASLESIAELLHDYGLLEVKAADVAAMLRLVRQSPIWERAGRSPTVFREMPFTRTVDGGALQRGVIDLVFREDDGWVVVDYKSDRLAAGADAQAAAQRHAGQLAAYADAWRAISGEAVKEAGICYLRTGEYVVVDV